MFDNMVVYATPGIEYDLYPTPENYYNVIELKNAEIPFSTICSQENTEKENTEELSGWES